MSDVTRSIRWREVAEGGTAPDLIEHCVVKIGSANIAAEGIVIGGAGETEYGLRYRIVFDAEWAGLRSLHITKLGGATLALRHDGYGNWTDGEGKKRDDLAKCLDLHLEGSHLAFTGTVKRQAWKAKKALDLPMIVVDVPSLEVKQVLVKVTAIEPGKNYRLEPEGGTAREVMLDADGFVLDRSADAAAIAEQA